ncbi:MAG: hypothetical protein ACI4BD_09145 [Paludibacteraceae bacterium]
MHRNWIVIFALFLASCSARNRDNGGADAPEVLVPVRLVQVDSLGWLGPDTTYADNRQPDFSVETVEPIRLNFFGWSAEEDYRFRLQFPENTEPFGLVQLSYTMCAWGEGPADWDMTTQIMVLNKQTGEWQEISRCITPYGGYFDSNWSRTYYIDVTEFLPILTGDTEFRIFYCGWDATDKKAHALSLRFDFYKQENPYGTPAWQAKIYDSTTDGGNTGYRSWAYGVQPDSLGTNNSIETDDRLGLRTLQIPAGTKQVLFRVCFTGHGQDALTGAKGTFPGRTGYKAVNPAEFDENFYTIRLNGETIEQQGHIWEINKTNYKQAGTYKYNRCGWGPGKPCNVQHWLLTQIPAEGETITLDFDLDEYISKNTSPRAESVAQFYVEVDAFGYR